MLLPRPPCGLYCLHDFVILSIHELQIQIFLPKIPVLGEVSKKSSAMLVGVLLLIVMEAMNGPQVYPESQSVDTLQWYFSFEDV